MTSTHLTDHVHVNQNHRELDSLNTRQRLFAEELIADPALSLVEAARRAGYPKPERMAYKLIANPKIKRAVSAAINRRILRNHATQDSVLEALAGLIQFDPIDIFQSNADGTLTLKQLEDMDPNARKWITKFKVRSKTYTDKDGGDTTDTEVEIGWGDKLAGIKLLAQHLGMMPVSGGKNGGDTNVQVNLISSLRSAMEDGTEGLILDDDVIESHLAQTKEEQKPTTED